MIERNNLLKGKSMRNLFSWFIHPKTPGIPKTKLVELKGIVNSLNKECRCKSVMNYILRSLDYEPDNHDVLVLAREMVWLCTGVHHTCIEPVSEVQINDTRLNTFFNECSDPQCFSQWIPTRSVIESWYGTGAQIAVGGATGSPGYCRRCNKAFCVEHVADPLPTVTVQCNPHCPICGHELDCKYVNGRKARQAPRENKKLSCVVMVREGFIPPDKEYCLKVFRNSSSDVLEDLPHTIGMNLHPWKYDANHVLDTVRSWLEAQTQLNCPADQMAIWTGLDTGTNTNFHLVKVWETTSRVTLDNMFTIPPCSENFPFETATFSEEASPKHPEEDPGKIVTNAKKVSWNKQKETAEMVTAPALPELTENDKMPVPKITQDCLAISLVDSSKLGDAGPGGSSFEKAIQHMNRKNDDEAKHFFGEALRQGLDPLRQGYVHTNLGEINLRANDIDKALYEFIKVLNFKEALYESVHNTVQYLGIIYGELGKLEAVGVLEQLRFKTSSKINYSLSSTAVDKVRQLTIENKPRFLELEANASVPAEEYDKTGNWEEKDNHGTRQETFQEAVTF